VRQGETVVAWDPVTGELGRHEVTNTFERTADHVRVLEFAAEEDGPTQTLETTDEHPFWSVDAGTFVAAGELRLGDRFISPAGGFSTLVATHRDEHPAGVPVYNFEVADVHNYYVRAHGLRAPPVRVHNAQGYGGGAPAATIDKAIAARDRIIKLMQGKYSSNRLRSFSTVVGGVDEATGMIIVKAKSTPRYGNALCAEDLVVQAFGGNKPTIRMTPAIRPRTNAVVPVCPRCQVKYPSWQFPFGYGG
jgi:hypothetical protein